MNKQRTAPYATRTWVADQLAAGLSGREIIAEGNFTSNWFHQICADSDLPTNRHLSPRGRKAQWLQRLHRDGLSIAEICSLDNGMTPAYFQRILNALHSNSPTL